MATTYEPIATTTLGSLNNAVTFSNIPATYTDLRIVLVGNPNTASAPRITVNGDEEFNYSNTNLYGDGETAYTGRNTNTSSINLNQISWQNSLNAMLTIDVFSYASAFQKTLLINNSADFNGMGVIAQYCGLWRSTNAINSITIKAGNNSWVIGTTATIYGIKAA